jgi:predicted DsbA family dithiol-disulfide isomerase
MIRMAARRGDAASLDAILEALMRAYFTDGRDIGDRTVLTELAAASGLDRQAARALLDGDEDVAEIRAEDLQARRAGIEGVPCFIVNGHYALSGAQEPEAFYALFDMALQDAREAAAR